METGKTAKYFKYVIGEILLVVIGILIALSINNWNSNRIMKSDNKKYLKKMISDLQANSKRFHLILQGDSTINNFEKTVKANDSLLKLTYFGLNKSNLNYVLNVHYYPRLSTLNTNDNTYQELINTGKLYTLGSEELIKAITTYYKLCERETVYTDGNNKYIQKGFEKFESGFGKIDLDANYDSANFNIENYPFCFDKQSKEYKDFQVGLAYIYGGQRSNMAKLKILIKETDALLRTINISLNND